MTALTLTPEQRRTHRAEAHHLEPVVLIGDDGLTPAVLNEVDRALNAHGLIKVRVFSDDRLQRHAILGRLTDELDAAAVQHVGKLLVLWRMPAAKSKPEREARMAAPRVVKLVTFSKSGNHRPTVKKVKVFGNQRLTAGGTIKRAKKRPVSLKKSAAE